MKCQKKIIIQKENWSQKAQRYIDGVNNTKMVRVRKWRLEKLRIEMAANPIQGRSMMMMILTTTKLEVKHK